MNRAACNLLFGLVLATTGCSYDLTEATLDARPPSFVVIVESSRGSDTRIRVQVDPGVSEQGVPGTLVHDTLLIDGTAYAPTARPDQGGRLYDVPIPESATSVSIRLPPPAGSEPIPTLAVVPLVLVVSDTLVPNAAGVIELTFSGVGEVTSYTYSNWSAALMIAGSQVARFQGGPGIPSVVRIATVHLPAEVQAGHVDVTAVSAETFTADNAVDIAVLRTLRASVPFRISH